MPDGTNRHRTGGAERLPDRQPAAPPVRDIPVLPAQAMAHGSTIIRPGAVAWGGFRDSADRRYGSFEAVEQALAAVAGDAGQLGALLAELARASVWVPLPAGRRPFTDGTAVVLPTVSSPDGDFIPCFTSVQRLNTWVNPPSRPAAGGGFSDVGRRWQRAGDSRVVPHIVVPAAGLARRLPAGTGLVFNPDSEAGVPLSPECVAFLARLPGARTGPAAEGPGEGRGTAVQITGIRVGDPPAEPVALLREALAGLRGLPSVRQAARAWLMVPGRGEGLVISVTLDDPARESDRAAVIDALERAVAEVRLQVPFPVDVTFPGEPAPGGEAGPELIDAWVASNAHPFYIRE